MDARPLCVPVLLASALLGGSAPPALATARTPLAHLIIEMKENHSFDNYFGVYPGGAPGIARPDGIPSGVLLPAVRGGFPYVHPARFPATQTSTQDPAHTPAAQLANYDGGRNDGFVYASLVGVTAVGYFTAAQLAVYWSYAAAFTLSDGYYCSVLGPSQPNRLFGYLAQSGVIKDNGQVIGGRDIFQDPLRIPSIQTLLDQAGVSWRIYVEDLPDPPPSPPFTLGDFDSTIAFPGGPMENVVPLSRYFADLQGGTLPEVAYIVGSNAHDEHPGIDLTTLKPIDIVEGELTTVRLVNALMQSPYWPSTAFLITYDENGGFWDHAALPSTDYGFRVPFLAISPWARPGFVLHAPEGTVFDHASLVRLIEDNFGLPRLASVADPDPLGATPRDDVAGDLMAAFDFAQPPVPPLILPEDHLPAFPPAAAGDDIRLGWTADARFDAVADTVTYTFTYLNDGSQTAHGAVATARFDSRLTVLSTTPAADAGTIDQWTVGQLAPRTRGTITVVTRVDSGLASGTTVTTTSELQDSRGDFVQASTSTSVATAPLLVQRSFAQDGVRIETAGTVTPAVASGRPAGTITLALREPGGAVAFSRSARLRGRGRARRFAAWNLNGHGSRTVVTLRRLPGRGPVRYAFTWRETRVSVPGLAGFDDRSLALEVVLGDSGFITTVPHKRRSHGELERTGST
jgi:phospholipase C